MVIAVASGKGGTGKTTVASSLALSLPGARYLDCDVEEPNGHLFLKPNWHHSESVSIKKPLIDESKCTYCGKCVEVCQFNALAVFSQKILLFDHICHGCGACSVFCPEKAISEVDYPIGKLKFGEAMEHSVAHGVLNVGESLATPVVRQLKESIQPGEIAILDAPPGTNCPVVETVHNSDYCILVTEATPFGLHDLKLAVDMVRDLEVPAGVVINKANEGYTKVEEYCQTENIPILLKIPFDRKIAEGYSAGKLLIEMKPEYVDRFRNLFATIQIQVGVLSKTGG